MGSMLINYKTTSCEHRGIHIAVIKFPLPKANKYTITFIWNAKNIFDKETYDNHFLMNRLK